MNDAEFESIFESNKDAVYAFAWRMTGSASTAEDVAQDCFLQLLRAPNRYDRSRGPVRAWLLGVARNLVLKRWRNDGRWTSLQDETFAIPPVTRDCRAEERVGEAIRSLPPLQREVLILIEYEGLTLEETARAVTTEVGTVKARLHRARENLRRVLAPLKGAVL